MSASKVLSPRSLPRWLAMRASRELEANPLSRGLFDWFLVGFVFFFLEVLVACSVLWFLVVFFVLWRVFGGLWCLVLVAFSGCSSPPDRLLDFMLESAFACFYTTPPPSIPPEQLASGSRRASRQSGCSGGSPVDPAKPVDPAEFHAEYPRVARQWIPSLDPAEYPAEYPRVACKWIPPSIPPE